MRTITCPICGTNITVPGFSRGDELANGEHVFCSDCGCMVWAPLQPNFKPTAFPNAVAPSGQPWMTPRVT